MERNRGDSRKGSHHSPEGHRINSIPRRVRESVPRKYEIGEHKFVRIYDRPRTNVSTSGRVLPVLRPPSTSESISQVLHPPPPRQTNFRRRTLDRNFPRNARFIVLFFFLLFLFHRSLSFVYLLYLVTHEMIYDNRFSLRSIYHTRICVYAFVSLTREFRCRFLSERFLRYHSQRLLHYFENLLLSFFYLSNDDESRVSHDNKFSPPLHHTSRSLTGCRRICNTELLLARKIDAKRSRSRSLSRIFLIG